MSTDDHGPSEERAEERTNPAPPARLRRRWRVWAAGGAVAVLVAGVWAASGDPDEPEFDDTLTGAVAGARVDDTVPRARVVTGIHPDCGLPRETVERLVGDGERSAPSEGYNAEIQRWCTWEVGDVAWNTGGFHRRLEVEATAHVPDTGGADAAVAEAVRDFGDAVTTDPAAGMELAEITETTAFTGLGDEAVLVTAVDAHGALTSDGGLAEEDVLYRSARTTIHFRVDNVVLRVAYSGADYERDPDVSVFEEPEENLLAPENTWGGAITAAEAIAASLGAEPADTLEAARDDGATHHSELPDTCADLLGRDPAEAETRRETEHVYLFRENDNEVAADEVECEWEYGELSVEAGVIDEERYGGGAAATEREYLYWYLTDRIAPGSQYEDEPDPDHLFVPLSGLGDAAHAAYVSAPREASVVFRDGNLLVRVSSRTWSDPGEAPNPDETLNRLHGAAEEVLAALA